MPGALLTNAISSLGNLALSIAIAHVGSLADLGQYGVALAVYVLATGTVRTAVTDTVLSHEHSNELDRRSLRRIVLLGLMAALLACVAGLLLSQTYVVLLGCAMPGIVVYDYVKVVNLGTGVVARALAQEVVWTAVTIFFAVLALTHRLNSHEAFAGWAFSCAAIGLFQALRLRYNLRPGWNVDHDETKVGLTFALDFLAGSGIAQMTTISVAAAAGVAVAGALRGAGTILAPLTIISATAPSLLIPYLAKARRASADAAARAARRVVLVATVVAVPVILGLLAIPSGVGHAVLGSNWEPARDVLPMVAAELFFAILAAIPFAGHRIERAGVRALAIRLARAPFQIGVVVACATVFGARGAASAMAVMSLVGAASWWLSYRQLLRNPAPANLRAEPAEAIITAWSGDEWYGLVPPSPWGSALSDAPKVPPSLRELPLAGARSKRLAYRAERARREPTREGVSTPHQDEPASQTWIARFPVTSLLALQYGALTLWPAWWHHDDATGFMVWIFLVGAVSAFAGEAAANMTRPRHRAQKRIRVATPRSATTITVLGFFALYASALLGARTFATQVGSTAASPLARIATPFIPWVVVGTSLTLCCWVYGTLSRRAALVRIGLAIAGYLGYAVIIHITAPLGQFLLAVSAGALLTRLIRIRWLVVSLLALLLVWPALYDLRNAGRRDLVTTGPYGQTVSASQRLREDLLLQPADEYPAPMGLSATSLLDVIHYGVIPSVIDPFPRPDLNTAKELSVATGGAPTNSLTFTLFGNIRAVAGTPALVLVMMLIGFGIARLAFVITPMRLVIVMASVQGVIWIESMYPDNLAGVLQTAVSALLALLCIAIARDAGRAASKRRRLLVGRRGPRAASMAIRRSVDSTQASVVRR